METKNEHEIFVLLFSFSRRCSDVDIMLFDEIHNKRAFQIMPLNPSPFFSLSLPFSSGKVICHYHNRWERYPIPSSQTNITIFFLHPYLSPERERGKRKSILSAIIIDLVLPRSILLFFFLSLRFLGGRTFSSGLSSWSLNSHPSYATQVLLLLFRRHDRCREKDGKQFFFPRAKQSKWISIAKPHSQLEELVYGGVRWLWFSSSSLDDNNRERKETIKSERERERKR